MMRSFLSALVAAAALCSPAAAQYPSYPAGAENQSNLALVAPTVPTSTNNNRVATTAYVQNVLLGGLPLTNGNIYVGNVSNQATAVVPSGDLTMNNAGVFTFGTVNASPGTFGSTTQCAAVTVNGKGLVTTATQSVCTPAIASVTGLGTGIAAALAINTGSAGAPVLFNGAGGTPSSMVGTNITGTAASLTAGNATKLATARAIGIGGSTGLTATGVNFDGTAAINPALTGTLAVANGGTGDTGTAWTSYSPTLSCVSGTLTSASATGSYKQLGKTVFLRVVVTITTLGTCVTGLNISLPVNPVASIEMSIQGKNVVVGQNFTGRIRSDATPNNSITSLTKFDGTLGMANGDVIAITGLYEAN
ncbi:hypothetical protein [Bradyrhizobium cajani]|uniref:Uncharacterized protein n=1 Tax=Bradyrhizobium cajani TaxID=1928661 RepID=A0A844TJ31_9BRAD|nr:hypothetical protein [Bradyrhizobium cajani]MCP3370779.1 hypothetical protein [Bradyrhizobium cajani]MVT75884.1 hypothetical protein [Bradyrhizobium cajani]